MPAVDVKNVQELLDTAARLAAVGNVADAVKLTRKAHELLVQLNAGAVA